MTIMERPTGLILSILCVSNVRGLSETARLEINGQKSMQKPIEIITDCKCNHGEVMKFTIDDKYLPDFNDLDLLASTEDSAVHFKWDKNSILCAGDIQHQGDKMHVQFTVDRNCGVKMPSGSTPKIIAQVDGAEYTGHLMEANLHFFYTAPSGQTKHLTAILACACKDDEAVPDECSSTGLKTTIEHTCPQMDETPVKTCRISSTNVDHCATNLQSIVIKDAVEIPLKTTAEIDLNFNSNPGCNAIVDRGTFYDITIEYTVDMVLDWSAINLPDYTSQKMERKLFTCKKSAHWANYLGWTECQGLCGQGSQLRYRVCQNGIAGLPGCSGDSVETRDCDLAIKCGKSVCPEGTDYTLGGSTLCKCRDDSGSQLRYILYPNHLISDSVYDTFISSNYLKFTDNFIATVTTANVDDKVQSLFVGIPHSTAVFPISYPVETFVENERSLQFSKSETIWNFVEIWPVDLQFINDPDQFDPTRFKENGHELTISKQELLDSFKGSTIFISSKKYLKNDGAGGSYFESVLEICLNINKAMNINDGHPYVLSILTKLNTQELFCQKSAETVLATPLFIPHCPAVLTRLSDCLHTEDTQVEEATCPIKQSLNEEKDDDLKLNNIDKVLATLKQAKKCAKFCNKDTLAITCTEIETLNPVSLLDYAKCGECGPCNQLEYTCINGGPIYRFHTCDDKCIACTAEDVTGEWSEWSACTNTCDGADRTRTRKIQDGLDLVKLPCAVEPLTSYSKRLSETENCNLKCCGWSESWTEWIAEALSVDTEKCERSREQVVSCTDKDRQPLPFRETDVLCLGVFESANMCHPEMANVCDPQTDDGFSEVCLQNDGLKCCHQIKESESPWSPCVGQCAYAHETRVVDQCGASHTESNDDFCNTGNQPCKCESIAFEYNIASKYNCVDIPTATCVPAVVLLEDDIFDGTIVSKQCTIKDEFKDNTDCKIFEQESKCKVQQCSKSVRSNCCENITCGLTTGLDCNQASRKCYDSIGSELLAFRESQDCCVDYPVCSPEEVKAHCPACDSTFPKCLDDPEKIMCTSGDIKCVHDPSSCQCGNFECGSDSFELPLITNQVLEDMHLNLPDVLYTPKLRFFLESNWDKSFCYHVFDRNEEGEAMKFKYTYTQAEQCGSHKVGDKFEIQIFVDSNKVDHLTLATHTLFARVSCVMQSPTVLKNTLQVVPRFLPLVIKDVIEPGHSHVEFELASDPEFLHLLDEDKLMANAHLVGEKIYARIQGKEPIKLISCQIRSLDNDMSEVMIEDGCIKPTMKSAFQMAFIETGNDNEIQVVWQNFYFRKLTTPRQRVSYDCQVAPCFTPPCHQTCDNKVQRKRRTLKDMTNEEVPDQLPQSLATTGIPPPDRVKFPRQTPTIHPRTRALEDPLFDDLDKILDDRDEVINSEFRFWIDVFKTVEDLTVARQELDKWEKDRQITKLMGKLAILTSSVLAVIIMIVVCFVLLRRIRKKANDPTVQRKHPRTFKSDHSNNNIGIDNKAFHNSC